MADLIDRKNMNLSHVVHDMGGLAFLDDVEEYIGSLPSVDAEPVRHAHWVRMRGDAPGDFHCSHCGAIAPIDEEVLAKYHRVERYKTPRCAWCGTLMDEKVQENEAD